MQRLHPAAGAQVEQGADRRRTVAAASVSDAPPTPVTCSRSCRAAGVSMSDTTHQSVPGSPSAPTPSP
nr:hypothetical protein [Pseudonocardia sp. ICBG601]